MKNLGLVFKTMRKSRKLSLAEATGGLFSISMLSRFENGQAEMSAEKLRECLENIYLQMGEFEFMVSEFQPSEIEELHWKLTKYRSPFQKQALEMLLAEQKQKFLTSSKKQFYRLNTIWIKAVLSASIEDYEVPKEDIDFLTNYLFSTEIWARYELLLFSETAHLFDSQLYLSYCQEMLKRSSFFRHNNLNDNLIHTMLVNGLFHATKEHNFLESTLFEHLLSEHFADSRDAFMRIMEKIARGYHQLEEGNSRGKQEIEQGILIFEQLGYFEQVNYFKEVFKDKL